MAGAVIGSLLLIGTMSMSSHYDWSQAERDAGLPVQVLYAIALQESQKPDGGGAGRPWPYTLNVAGKGYWFESREAAENAIELLLQRGIQAFDIGAMQISWRWNNHLAAHPAQLLSSQYNLWAAAQVVRECRRLMPRGLHHLLACYHRGPKPDDAGYRYAEAVLRKATQLVRTNP